MFTDRLIIRRFASSDLNDLHEYLSNAKVVKYEPYPPLSKGECRECLEQMMASEEFWAVCLKDGEKQIGQVYLSEKEQNTWELGYVFNCRYQHQGFAFEAARALISYVFENRRAHRVYANCNPDNEPSWRLLERLGFRREGHLRQNIHFNKDEKGNPIWQDTFEYGILRSEWKQGQKSYFF